MLTPEKIDELNILAGDLMGDITDWLITDIISRIAETTAATSTAMYELKLLERYGVGGKKLLKTLSKRLGMKEEELIQLIEDAGETAYLDDMKRFRGKLTIPWKQREDYQQLLMGIKAAAEEDFENLTGTIGFIGPDGMFSPLTEAYRKTSAFAYRLVASGAADYGTALRSATANLLSRGIQTVNYESGITTEIGAAVRRNIMSSIGNLTNEISEKNHDELGCDGWEISAHSMSAPDHEAIQGKRFTNEEFEKMNAGLKRPIGTLNCGHIAFPVFLDDSEPVYSKSELKTIETENKTGITYEGKHYTLYEATQKQRLMERKMRRQQYEIDLEKEIASNTGDKTKLKAAQTKYNEMLKTYNAFSKFAGLRSQYNRLRNV